MKANYKLQGLCCATCADQIERGVNKLEGITSAKLSFMTTKLSFEAEEAKLPELEEKIKKLVKKIEPDVVLQKA